MDYVNLVVLLSLCEYATLLILVGALRGKFGISPPATTGHPQWERLHRIQVNTAEQIVLFIPSVYAFAHYVAEGLAAGLGSVFLVGRLVYFLGYRVSADKRLLGAALSGPVSYLLLLGALVGLMRELL